MLISLNMLNSFLDKKIIDYQGLLNFLTSIGIEVENIIDQKEKLLNIVVGKIIEKTKHSNAEKLSILKVDIANSILQIVCGATNQKEGDKVVVALENAKLPNGLTIKKTNIRGIESNGMCCSYSELGMEKESEGIIILGKDELIGKNIYEVFGFDDVLFEVAIYPNRGDLLSHLGLAREAKLFNKSNLSFKPAKVSSSTSKSDLKIIIEDNNCLRYLGRKFNNVKITNSPAWLIKSLEKLGLRSINNLVDITNYIMHYLGQPLHIFDADKVKDSTIIVRKSKKNEKLTLLDEKKIILNEDDILITGKDSILALAGLMGGIDSSVVEDTKNIILECAVFNSSKIRKTARSYNISTDSSYRFERGVDFNNLESVVEYASFLIDELASPSSIEDVVEAKTYDYKFNEIEISIQSMNNFLGININKEAVIKILEDLNFKISLCTSLDLIKVIAPSYRNDIKIKEDVYEEILRIYGFNNIEVSYPGFNENIESNAVFNFENKIKNILKNLSYNEVINYSFIANNAIVNNTDKVISLINPISEEMKYLRPNLLSSLLENIKYNFNHRNNDLKLFELGKRYLKNIDFINLNKISLEDKIVFEDIYLAGIISGKFLDIDSLNGNKNNYNFFDLKGEINFILDSLNISSYKFKPSKNMFLHPNISLSIETCGKEAGSFGKLNPILLKDKELSGSIFYFELEFDKLYNNASTKIKFKDFSKYPSIRRDISFLIDSKIPYANVEENINKLKLKELSSFFIFDVYKGSSIPEDKQSITLGLIFSNNNRTLTDKEVDILLKELINSLKHKFSIEIR